MEIKIDYVNIPDPKVIIYTETANQIFIECFRRAEEVRAEQLRRKQHGAVIKNPSSRYTLLSSMMMLVIENSPVTNRFLQKKNNEIQELLANGEKYSTIGFDHHHLLTLSRFAGIDDYDVFNQQYAPVNERLVCYTARRFSWYEVIRVPKRGLLTESAEGWVLKDTDTGKVIRRGVSKINLFTMPADSHAIWYEVVSKDQEIVYFATDSFKPATEDDRLFRFFSSFIS